MYACLVIFHCVSVAAWSDFYECSVDDYVLILRDHAFSTSFGKCLSDAEMVQMMALNPKWAKTKLVALFAGQPANDKATVWKQCMYK